MSIRETTNSIQLDFYKHGGSSFIKCVHVYFFDARFRLLLNYRIGHYLKNSKSRVLNVLAGYYKYKQVTKRGCEISYKAEIGNVLFVHPISIVIGEGVIIADNVEIYQGVTIGTHGRKNEKFRYPEIHAGARIFSGVTIVGDVKIGANATIGANSLVLGNIPDNSVAVGSPAVVKNKIV